MLFWGVFGLMNPLVLVPFLVFSCELRKATFAHSYLQKTDDERQKVREVLLYVDEVFL